MPPSLHIDKLALLFGSISPLKGKHAVFNLCCIISYDTSAFADEQRKNMLHVAKSMTGEERRGEQLAVAATRSSKLLRLSPSHSQTF